MTQNNTPQIKTQSESHEKSNKYPMLSACLSGAVVGGVVYGSFWLNAYWDYRNVTEKTKTSIVFTMYDSIVAEKANRYAGESAVPAPTPLSHNTFQEELEEQNLMMTNSKSIAESVGTGPVVISLAIALGVAAVHGLLSNKPKSHTPAVS